MLVALAMLLSLCTNLAYADGNATLTVNAGAITDGKVVVTVDLSNNTGIAGIAFKLNYDNTKLVPKSYEKFSILGSGNCVSNFDQAKNDPEKLAAYKFAQYSFSGAENSDENGTMLSITFAVQDGEWEETSLNLEVNAGDVCDQDYADVDVDLVHGAVTLPELEYTFDGATKVYNGSEQLLVAKDSEGNAFAENEVTYTNNANKDAGTYTVTATVKKAGYKATTKTATLTINPKEVRVEGLTAANKEYDGNLKATLSVGTISGIEDCDTNKIECTMPTEGEFSDKNVGENIEVTYPDITLSGDAAGNYTVVQPELKANITKKPITVTAKDVTAKVNSTMEDVKLTYTVEGLVDGDTLKGALAVDGKVDFSKVGEYNIVKGDLDAGTNYDLTFVGAKLKVIDKTPQTITVAPVDTKTYGDAPFALTVTADETSKLSAFKYASSDEKVATVDASGNVTIVGAGKATITVTEPGNADYAEATATAELTVAPKAITVTAVDLKAKTATFAEGGILEADVNDVKVDFDRLKTTVKSTTVEDEMTLVTVFAVSNFNLTGAKAANYTVTASPEASECTSRETIVPPTPEEGKNTITSVTVGDTVVVPAIAVGAQATEVKIEAPKAVSMPKTEFDKIDVPLTIALKDGADDKGSIVLDVAALTAIKTAATSATQISTSMKADVAVDDLTSAQQTEVAKVSAKTPKVYSLSVVDENGASLASDFNGGKAVVKLPYTKPAGNGNVKVKHVANDGTLTDVVSTYENGFVKVELGHFSEYLVYTEPEVIVTGGGSASTYTVKFNTNGGSTIKSVSVNKNGVVAEPTAPTKKGYTFDGWYTDRQLTTPYDFTSKVTKNFTLFAKWIEDSKEPGTEEPGTDEPGTEEPTTVSFDDINETDWFYENVKYVVENKLMNGVSDTEFAPNNTLTRAMLVTVLYRNAGEPEVTEAASFADVDADAWYANAVVWAEANGIVNGVSDTEFAPNANITREQIATIMYRYAQYNGDDVTAVADIEAYADATNVSDYAVDAMKYAVGSGLINGKTETTLNPQDNATRAEIATILKRFIEANAVVENPAEGTTEETTEEVVEETTEETVEETVEETTEETAE